MAEENLELKELVLSLAKSVQGLAEQVKELKEGAAIERNLPSELPITDEPLPDEDEQEGGDEDVEDKSDYVPPNERLITDEEPVEEEQQPDELQLERPVPANRRRQRPMVLGGEDAVDEDYVDMTQKRTTTCHRMPFEIKKRKNRFVDTLVYAKEEIEELSPKVIEQKKRRPKRAKIKPVRVKCAECRRIFLVDPLLAPRRITSEDSNRYVCNDCIGSNINKRRD